MTYKSKLITGCTLVLVLTGCLSGRRDRVRTVNRTISEASLSDEIRAIFQISQEDSDADKEALKQLFQRRPELAELAEQIASDPGNLGGKRLLADAYLAGQLYLQAFRLYEELRSINAEAPAAELGLAQVWHHWNDQAAARRYAESVVSRDPNMTAAWDLLGRIHLRDRRRDDALAAWERATHLEPDNATLLSNIGYLLLVAGDWDNARTYLERAVGINGSLVEAQNNLGIVLARSGDSSGALRHFMSVNAPAAAHNNLGVVYLAEGRKTEAVQQFSYAVELDPAYVIARNNLAQTQAEAPSPALVELRPLETRNSSTRPEPRVETDASSASADAAFRPEFSASVVPSVHESGTPKWTVIRRARPQVSVKSDPVATVQASQDPWGIGFYWLILMAGAVGLAGARELSRACLAGRQEWGSLKRFASLATVAGVLVVIASGLVPRV